MTHICPLVQATGTRWVCPICGLVWQLARQQRLDGGRASSEAWEPIGRENLPDDEAPTELTIFDRAVDVITSFAPGSDPRSIVARVFAQPFVVPGEETQSFDVQALISAGKRKGTEIELPEGVGFVNRVTAEQLLAIVAAIIATSTDATRACQRIRAEVDNWKFQGADGVIR